MIEKLNVTSANPTTVICKAATKLNPDFRFDNCAFENFLHRLCAKQNLSLESGLMFWFGKSIKKTEKVNGKRNACTAF